MTWRQKDLKPQAASLLGKKHSSVNLVSAFAKARKDEHPAAGDGGGGVNQITTKQTTTTTGASTQSPIRRRLFNWSAKKSSFDEDVRSEARAGGKRTLLFAKYDLLLCFRTLELFEIVLFW